MTVYAPSEVKAAHFAPLAVTDYISEVDALRCMAMTGVVAMHCRLLPFGWTGVWLFYVISGFAITSSLLASGRRPARSRCFYETSMQSDAFAFGRSIFDCDSEYNRGCDSGTPHLAGILTMDGHFHRKLLRYIPLQYLG